MTKGANRKSRLDQRQARIAVAADEPDKDDDDDEDKTEQDKLECEARELSSQLKKAERAESLAQNKEEREKAKHFSKCISEGKYLKQPKAVTLVPQRKRKKVMKMESIKSADEEDEADTIPEGFHLQEESPHCINMQRAGDYQAYLRQLVLDFETVTKKWSNRYERDLWKSNSQHVLGGQSKQTNNPKQGRS